MPIVASKPTNYYAILKFMWKKLSVLQSIIQAHHQVAHLLSELSLGRPSSNSANSNNISKDFSRHENPGAPAKLSHPKSGSPPAYGPVFIQDRVSPTLPCNICKKRFEKLTALDHHIRANHPVLQCECCGKTLRSKPDLNLHLHKHHYAYNVDDTENYFCQSPSLSKTNFDSQSIHEMYNTADLLGGPPRCNVCGYHSLSIPDLNLHKHRHHGNISQAGSEPGPNASLTSLDPQRPSHLQLTGAESPSRNECNQCTSVSENIEVVTNNIVSQHKDTT